MIVRYINTVKVASRSVRYVGYAYFACYNADMKRWATKKQDGFTIVELLIVIVVIGILAAITIVAFNGVQDRARQQSVMSDLQSIKKSMLLYRADRGVLPPGADFYSGSSGPPPATWSTSVLNSMRTNNYITTSGLERDPWGSYYWYDNNDCSFGQGGSSPLKSIGPDGVLNTADDIGISIVVNC